MEIKDNLFEKKEHLNSLYDVYKDLLTPKQREYFEAYFFDDLSLKEIAENSGVSRNAVFTSLKSIEDTLEEYECKLKIKEKRDKIINIIEENDSIEEIKEKIKNIL